MGTVALGGKELSISSYKEKPLRSVRQGNNRFVLYILLFEMESHCVFALANLNLLSSSDPSQPPRK